MKKTITLLALLISFCGFSQEKSTTITSEEPAKINLAKFGTLYYDKVLESDMLKIKTGAMKLSKYNPQDIPEFVAIYNSLYTKSASIVQQMPPHIAVLKKYYNLYKIQRRNMSQANISDWSKAIKAATPIRVSMQKIVMDEHYGDMSFYPTLKYKGIHEDFDLYYNASLNILGL
jgi:hypothetical protein